MISAMKALGSYVATDIQVSGELNKRNYFAAVGNDVIIQPFYTVAQNISASVDYAIRVVLGPGYANFASTKTYLNAMTWGNLVSTAIDKSRTLSEYTMAGMAGLSGLGQVYNPYCYDNTGRQVPCPDGTSSDSKSWWSDYGPMIVSIIGSTLMQIGTKWQQQVSTQQILDRITTSTAMSIPGTTASTRLALAQQLATSTGMPLTEAQAQIDALFSRPALPKTTIPSWLLPALIAVGAYSLLKGRRQ